MKQGSPCKVGAKLRGQVTQGSGVYSLVSLSADADLELGEDGTFERTLPLTATIELRLEGCTTDYRFVNPQLHLAGGYRDDASLAFASTKMTWDGVTGSLNCGPLTCSFNSRGQSVCMAGDVLVTGPAWSDFSGIDPAAGGLALALADGSRGALPRPAGLSGDAIWQGSLELTYGSGGPAAVAVARAALN